MPKLPPAKKLANSILFILIARLSMAAMVPCVTVAATVIWNKLDSTEKNLVDVKLALAALQATTVLSDRERSASIATLTDRLTYLERQSRK